MNFKNDKYEYVLHTWGGFYNEEYAKIHGKEKGYFFFDTMEQLQQYVKELRKVEKDIGAYTLMIDINEGKDVRYTTIAKMKMRYNGKEYDYEEDFGYAYPKDAARFMFFDGNYSCDCNKSKFIKRKYGDEIKEKDCGHDIEITEFEVLRVKR